jgi:hypothetical protein
LALRAEDRGEGIFKGLSEVVAHESVDQRVDRRVGVGHAVGPDLHLANKTTLYLHVINLHQTKQNNTLFTCN